MKARGWGIALALVAAFTPASADQPLEVGAIDVFARVHGPEGPEGILVRDGLVYVTTHAPVTGNANEVPSQLHTFDLDGVFLGSAMIVGQDTSGTHGALAIASSADGDLFVLDRRPPRIVRVDSETGWQSTYATFPELAPCHSSAPPCAPVTIDEPTFPDYLAFTEDGTAYVTDLQSATIFRVPPGGGAAEIWFQDARFDGIFGLNGIAVAPEGDSLVFAMTGSQQPTRPAQAIIYELPIVEAPQAGDLVERYVYDQPAAGADGIRFGASGKLYVALAGASQVSILDLEAGTDVRFPDPVENQLAEIPMDLPASIDFDDARRSILITNQVFLTGNPDRWAVLRMFVDDTGLPLVTPQL